MLGFAIGGANESFLVRWAGKEAAVAAGTTSATLDGRWARLRAHKRLVANVKFAVEWEESNERQSASAFTLDVSHSGCLAVVRAELKLGQMIRLIHRDSGAVAEARVVWRDPRTKDVGLEFLKPDAGFWSLW